MIRTSALALLCVRPTIGLAQYFTVCGYNVDSGGSDSNAVGQRLSEPDAVVWSQLGELPDDDQTRDYRYRPSHTWTEPMSIRCG